MQESHPRILLVTRAGMFSTNGHKFDISDPRCLLQARGQLWCGTGDGVWQVGDTPRGAGLEGKVVTALGQSEDGTLWAGTELSRMYRLRGDDWEPCAGFEGIASRHEWSFPPKPHSHHVRWIRAEPGHPDHLYVAIEAGALLRSNDGGQSWTDRVPGGPLDTHQLLTRGSGRLCSAAGDGYFESDDAGETWRSPEAGLSHKYLWGVAVFGEQLIISAAQTPMDAHSNFRSALYAREGGEWRRTAQEIPEASSVTVLRPPYAANSSGVFHSTDGLKWEQVADSTAWNGEYVLDFIAEDA